MGRKTQNVIACELFYFYYCAENKAPHAKNLSVNQILPPIDAKKPHSPGNLPDGCGLILFLLRHERQKSVKLDFAPMGIHQIMHKRLLSVMLLRSVTATGNGSTL